MSQKETYLWIVNGKNFCEDRLIFKETEEHEGLMSPDLILTISWFEVCTGV